MRTLKIFPAVFLLLLGLAMPLASAAGPDQVKLKNGKVINGAVLFWSGGELNFDSDEEGLLVINSSDLEEIHFAARPAAPKPSLSPAAS